MMKIMCMKEEIAAIMAASGILDHVFVIDSNVAGVNKKLEETEFHQAFVVNGNSIGYTFNAASAGRADVDDRPERIIKTFFTSIAAALSRIKVTDPDKATALVLKDTSGVFKFGGIVEYHLNADNPDEPGNWSFSMTFDESDITSLEKKKVVNKVLCADAMFIQTFDNVAYDVASIRMESSKYIIDACYLVIETLLQILDREAKAGETVDIEFPAFFVASVAVEGDEKVYAITPEGHLKAIIKDDSALEVDM